MVLFKSYTLSYMKPCHEVELKIVQASKGCNVQLEFHEWQSEYMTVCIWPIRFREFNPQQQDFQT